MGTQIDISHAVAVVRQEVTNLEVRRSACLALARLIPSFTFNRLRVALVRASGWRIERTSTIFGAPRVFGVPPTAGRIVVGHEVRINLGCTFELSDTITIGNGVSIGPNVTVLTSSHQLGGSGARAGAMSFGPVTIGDGAWIGAGSTVLSGVTIGPGAVVGAGSTINKDVPADSLVIGVPAQPVVRRLPG